MKCDDFTPPGERKLVVAFTEKLKDEENLPKEKKQPISAENNGTTSMKKNYVAPVKQKSPTTVLDESPDDCKAS